VLGVIVVLSSNVRFWRKRKHGDVKKTTIDIATPRFGLTDDELKNLNKQETDDELKVSPLGTWIYDNYRDSLRGSILTLLGVVISFIGILLGEM